MLDLTQFFFGFTFVDFVFIQFAIVMLVCALFMNTAEEYLPAAVRQFVRYGKFSYKGQTDKFISLLEVPKAWFKHFYAFAAIYAGLGGVLVVQVYFRGWKVPGIVVAFLDFVYGPNRIIQSRTSSV